MLDVVKRLHAEVGKWHSTTTRHRARRVLASSWWCGWPTFAVVYSAEALLNVGVLSFTIAA